MNRSCRILLYAALLSFLPLEAQTTCNFQSPVAGLTATGPDTAFQNNKTTPICNAFAISWNTGNPVTGVTALTIQFEGSDDNVTYTAFSGTSTVLVGTNPASTLSGNMIVQASTKSAYLRINITALSGSGKVFYQVNGLNGVTPAARGGSGGGGGGGIVTQNWLVGSGGVTAGQLVCPSRTGSPVTVVTCPITVVVNQISQTILGIAQTSGIAGSTIPVIVQGPATCVFDSINPVVAGDTVNYSITTPGTCQDSGGNSTHFGIPYIGIVASSGAASTTQNIWIYGPGLMGSAITSIAPMKTTNPGGLQPENFQIQAGNATSAQGTGTKLQFSTGATTTNDVVIFDATGNTIDSGVPVGSISPALKGSATFAFGSAICDGCCSQGGTIITVTGAATGDAVAIGANPALAVGIDVLGKATASNTVTVEVCNWSGSATTPGSTTYLATISH